MGGDQVSRQPDLGGLENTSSGWSSVGSRRSLAAFVTHMSSLDGEQQQRNGNRLRSAESLYVLRDFLRGTRYPIASRALVVECGGSTPGCRRSTMRCVSQWIRKFCGNSSATEVEEYGFNELWKKYEGCSMDMLESIVEDLSSMEDAKRVIVIRDPMACMRTVDDAAAVASGGDADVDGDDEDWGEEQSLARKSLDSTLGLVLWLARSVPIGVRIVLLVPSGATTDMFGEFCGVMRLTVGEVRDLSGSTSELPINPSGPLVGLLAHHRASRSLPHTRGGLICVSGPSGSGKTDELRRLRASVSSGKAIEVRIADVVAAELGESQRRLRKIYSELASCSRFSPTVPAVAMFDDCDLWVTSAGRVMGEILSQWTALLDVHKEDVWTVVTCEDREGLPESLSCRVTNWICLSDARHLANT